jgi:hypothetical protein
MSTSSFLTTVMAVLNNQSEIVDLPNDKLNAFTCEGDTLEEKIPLDILLKIAGLQTLIMQTREKVEMPDYETTQQIAKEIGVDSITAGANALAVSEDATHRVMMLERLIVEVVRAAFPKECGQFNVRYLARLDQKILRLPAQQLRFLD